VAYTRALPHLFGVSFLLLTHAMIYSVYRDFKDGEYVSTLGYDILIHTRSIGPLILPTGQLVACDPVIHPTTEPFVTELPRGEYPVHLTIAELRDEARVAYAAIHLKKENARSWTLATVASEDVGMFSKDEHGYTIISSLGAFMDAKTADHYLDYLEIFHDSDQNTLEKSLNRLEHKAKQKGTSFGNLSDKHLGKGNILTFSSGFGEGFYQTYIGKNAEGEITRVVTDFKVLDFRFPSFGF